MTETRERSRPASKTEKTYLALIAVVLLAIAAVLIFRPRTQTESAPAAPDAAGEPTVVRERERFVEVEKKISAETLRDGLENMGVLVTEEYYFTDLISFSSVKKFLKTDYVLPFTESSYLVSYDGVVSAGVDLTAARVEKDDERERITVYLPKAAIQAIDIDFDSFTLYEQKTGLGNPLSVEDFNASLRELERSAEEKAKARGLLEKADENGKAVIRQFIGGMVDLSEYELAFVTN